MQVVMLGGYDGWYVGCVEGGLVGVYFKRH